MTEDEMYDIIRGYEESELDYHERNIELENENAKLRHLCGEMLAYLLPSPKRHYSLKESMAIIDSFADMGKELGIEVGE